MPAVVVTDLEMERKGIPAADISHEFLAAVGEEQQVTERPTKEVTVVGDQDDERPLCCARGHGVNVLGEPGHSPVKLPSRREKRLATGDITPGQHREPRGGCDHKLDLERLAAQTAGSGCREGPQR